MQTRPLPENWLRTDALVAAVLAGLGMAMAWLSSAAGMSMFEQPMWQQALGSLMTAFPLVWRRRFPITAGIAQAILYGIATTWTGIDIYASQVALFLGFYSIGAWAVNRGVALVARMVIAAGMGLWLVLSVLFQLDHVYRLEAVSATALLAYVAIQGIVNVAYFAGAWIFGDRAFEQALERQELTEANASIAALQQELVESAIEDERIRIARELHDVVAHHVTAMSVQAAAARRLLDRDTERAATALQHIESSARSAVQDLRTMVLTLRESDGTTASLPTLADVDTLVADARTTGREISHEVIGDVPELTPAVELTLYRVAQEALTNVTKHAGPKAKIALRLRGTPDGVELEVSDDGVASPALLPGTGTGLKGMQERVAAVGGTLEVGPKPRGGFRVRAAIPTGVPA